MICCGIFDDMYVLQLVFWLCVDLFDCRLKIWEWCRGRFFLEPVSNKWWIMGDPQKNR